MKISETDVAFLKSYGLTPQSKPDFFTRDMPFAALYMLLSLGWYGLYWMYRNWDAIRVESGRPMLPALRAIFFPLYLWPLLKIIILLARRRGYASRFSGGQLALISLVPLLLVNSTFGPPLKRYQVVITFVIVAVCNAMVLLMAQWAILYNNDQKRTHPFNRVSWVEALFTLMVCIPAFTRHY